MAEERDTYVGKNIARFRGAESQQTIADRMRRRGWRWSQATMWAVERGDRPVRLVEAVDLAEILRVSLHDLLSRPSMAHASHDALSAAGKVRKAHHDAVTAIHHLEMARDELRAALDNASMFTEWQPDQDQRDLIESALGHVPDTVPAFASISVDPDTLGWQKDEAMQALTKKHSPAFTPENWRAERGLTATPVETEPPTPKEG
ncbi:helix-turn-helix domain-containing protein [Antribacter gilvus]|uniref:helix-turn-helix domain-containing protein n=1 Tax=Antribacter gilvus TaxID=2304675 RepID=UPI000F7B8217|nr:helix-turn-helix transcriptional regulator [Antribacter gilvus]